MIQETSMQAYKQIKDELGKRQHEVFIAIVNLERATNSMIAKHINLPINCITGRTNELRKKGLVIYSHTSWCPVTKNKAMYWRANGNKQDN